MEIGDFTPTSIFLIVTFFVVVIYDVIAYKSENLKNCTQNFWSWK